MGDGEASGGEDPAAGKGARAELSQIAFILGCVGVVVGGGWLFARGTYVRRDERACLAGEVERCVSAGRARHEGDETRQDSRKAGELYARACQGGVAQGCGLLGHLMRGGEGRPRDPAGALTMFERGCQGGDGASCVDAADLCDNGDGVPADPRRALTFHREACRLGFSRSCDRVETSAR